MSKTLAKTLNRAGRMLGIVKYSEALSADHSAVLTEFYEEVYDQLKDEGLAIWVSAGPLPDKVYTPVAALVAFAATEDIGVPAERYNRILARRNAALPAIRKYVTPAAESLEEPTDY